MGMILKLDPGYRFSVLEIPITNTKGHETVRRMIVIKNSDGLVASFTGFEYFAAPYTGRQPIIRERKRERLYYICNALNYIFIDQRAVYRISRLSEVTADMLFDAFDFNASSPKNAYADEYRSQQSIDSYVFAVSSFFANIGMLCTGCSVTPEELFYEKTVPNKYGAPGRQKKLHLPIYETKSNSTEESKLMRDIPAKALDLLIEAAEIYDPMLVFPIIVSKTCGLRLGELMNMRQMHSPLSATPGIRFQYMGSAVTNVEIDMTREYQMRSDGISYCFLINYLSFTLLCFFCF